MSVAITNNTRIYQSSTVYTTEDYSLFRFYDSNRPPEHWPKLAQSIQKKDLTKYMPIVVSKDFHIIDGQGRFLACKELSIPVHFIVAENATESDIILLNVGRENWRIENYLNFYVNSGYSDYVLVAQILDELPNLKVNDVLRAFQYRYRDMSTHKTFISGQYKINDTAVKKCRLLSQVLYAIEGHVPKNKIVGRVSIVSAICSAFSDISINRLIEQIKKYPFLFEPQADQVRYKRLLEEIYNYRKRDKVAFTYK